MSQGDDFVHHGVMKMSIWWWWFCHT